MRACPTTITMEHLKELLEHILRLLTGRFDIIDRKLDRLAKTKDIMDGDDLLDNQDVCQLLNIHPRTLQRYKQYKVLRYTIIRGKSYYWKSDVLLLLDKKK